MPRSAARLPRVMPPSEHQPLRRGPRSVGALAAMLRSVTRWVRSCRRGRPRPAVWPPHTLPSQPPLPRHRRAKRPSTHLSARRDLAGPSTSAMPRIGAQPVASMLMLAQPVRSEMPLSGPRCSWRAQPVQFPRRSATPLTAPWRLRGAKLLSARPWCLEAMPPSASLWDLHRRLSWLGCPWRLPRLQFRGCRLMLQAMPLSECPHRHLRRPRRAQCPPARRRRRSPQASCQCLQHPRRQRRCRRRHPRPLACRLLRSRGRPRRCSPLLCCQRPLRCRRCLRSLRLLRRRRRPCRRQRPALETRAMC
mmetsp:Transcript_68034/g.221484  ORF Transcript_68034/g.221484 Transcript_68034/m.221484 type:complete len:306 (-) Transcript_68034:208-1125(-)